MFFIRCGVLFVSYSIKNEENFGNYLPLCWCPVSSSPTSLVFCPCEPRFEIFDFCWSWCISWDVVERKSKRGAPRLTKLQRREATKLYFHLPLMIIPCRMKRCQAQSLDLGVIADCPYDRTNLFLSLRQDQSPHRQNTLVPGQDLGGSRPAGQH